MPAATDPEPTSTEGEPLSKAARVLTYLAAGLALLAVFFISMRPIAATDFWWQLKTGELIVHSGAIPRKDPFSWTAAGQPWVVHEWLTEVLFYFLYEHLPRWVLLGYKCGLAVVACGLVLVRGWQRSGSLALGIGAALAAACVLRNFADLRPQMISFVLLGGLLLALDRYQEGKLPKLPWILPAVFALWGNLHGGVVVGLIFIALWLAGQAIGRWIFRDPAPDLGRLFLGLAASCAAVALNPNGFHVYLYPFQVLGHPEVIDYISEWWSPNFHIEGNQAFEILLLGTPAVLALARSAPAGRRIGDVLVLLATAHAALISQRNTVAFALVAAPLVAAGVAALWNEVISKDALGWERLVAAAGMPALRLATAVSLLTATVGVLALSLPRTSSSRWYDDAVMTGDFPEGAAALLAEGMWPGKIYNDYVWGGYLIWRLPQRPVFIDGRAEVYYPTHAFDDEMKIHHVAAGWQKTLDDRGVEVVLTQKAQGLAEALKAEKDWKLAFTGKVEVVYVRTVGLKPAEKQP